MWHPLGKEHRDIIRVAQALGFVRLRGWTSWLSEICLSFNQGEHRAIKQQTKTESHIETDIERMEKNSNLPKHVQIIKPAPISHQRYISSTQLADPMDSIGRFKPSHLKTTPFLKLEPLVMASGFKDYGSSTDCYL